MSSYRCSGRLNRNQRMILAAVAILTITDIVTRAGLYTQQTKRSKLLAEGPLLPDVIIYRRSKKTGSSSMLEELLRETSLYGYTPLYLAGPQLKTAVRAEGLKQHPRKLFLAEHNVVTREDTHGRKTIVLDTFVDGYKQMTSLCRFAEKFKVQRCDDEMLECLRGPARTQRFFRWAYRKREERNTYLDIPLSSAHPAISTTAFRHIFPTAVLDVKRRNSQGSACPEDPRIRAVYQRNYRELELQIDTLRSRLLALAGYPLGAKNSNVSLSEMLDTAERLERERYRKEENLVFGSHGSTWGVSDAHTRLKHTQKTWGRDRNGQVVLSLQRQGETQV